ncbi:MAG TPA: hypothetical protein VLG09_05220, partial [Candidatus Saccharimonadales bacterium]|nr:hypothetical protein [Candidatus Saccharimonadales bacterium]
WTAPCGCVFELESDPDSNKPADRDNKFLLANSLCPVHEPLASKQKKPDHDTKSKKVKDILNVIKGVNIDASLKNIDKNKDKPSKKKDAELTHGMVIKHNQAVDEEWDELTSNDYAYDDNVYDVVFQENQNQSPPV